MNVNHNKPEKFLSPIMCWDIYAVHLMECKYAAKKDDELKALQKLGQQFNWKLAIEPLVKNDYDALVLTDAQQMIQWVSEGFGKMTGYTAQFAIGKSPRFLQGKNTSLDSRESIKQKVSERQPFSAEIVNYRKNGDEYSCHVTIHPLFNDKEELSHYLALEKEILVPC